ncbi:hypothetical protein HMPREF9372_0083 [Sporosarcina newyorkensis 2681]|uniref:DUF3885 domain-containing protein n=1 Tax=Sporosarcina newyorkensis 2681 TaxID=1027292 RepID=F9DMQ3_9BACL|nr:hypothetical protein HMPREF9372_0083 [Sporosarcina newyorkensis 2681]
MSVDQYMQEKFPNLKLRPPLFYNWSIGIRYELGVNYELENIHESHSYLEEVYKRASTLFKSIHSSNDDVYIVVDVNDFGEHKAYKRKLNIFSKYVKEKAILFKLQHHIIPYIFPEDDEEGTYSTYRFSLKCKVSDFNYSLMLKAICNQDMGVRPSIFHRIYFINVSKNTIFHIYDDRGCDLLANSLDAIRGNFEEYNEWILDYDRDEIDNIFKKSH